MEKSPHRVKQIARRANFYYFLEENYTSWTIQAIYDTGVNWGADMLGVRNNGQVIFWDLNADNCYIISPAGVLLATIAGDDNPIITTYLRGASLHDRYVLFRGWNGGGMNLVSIGVQEGLTTLWERVVDLDKGGYTLASNAGDPLDDSTASISSSGKWIVVGVTEDTTDNCLIFIYRGVPW